MAGTASFHSIDSSLGVLRKHYYKYIGLDGVLDDRFFDNINQSRNDWELLKMLCMYSSNQSSAAADTEVCVIEPAAQEFVKVLDGILYGENKQKMMKQNYLAAELVELAVEVRRQSELVIRETREIREAIHHFQVVHPPLLPLPDDDSFWKSFIDTVISNLRSISWCGFNGNDDADCTLVVKVSDFNEVLQVLRGYVTAVRELILDDHRCKSIALRAAGNAFLNHVASLILRTAIHSCDYWFNYKTRMTARTETEPPVEAPKIWFTKLLEDLQYEIEPRNPEFMKLHLNFLHVGSSQAGSQDGLVVDCLWGHLGSNVDLKTEVKSLVNLLINNQLDDKEDDVQSFFAETSALIMEIAPLSKYVAKEGATEDYPPSSELCTKICLLKAELFLKEQLRCINSSNSSSHMLFDKYHDEEGLSDILGKLQKFSKNLPPKKVEYGKQSLAIIQELAKKVASLHQTLEAENKIFESKVRNSLFWFLHKIVTFKAESFVMELSSLFKSKSEAATLMGNEKIWIEFLFEQLKLLNLLLINQVMEDMEGAEILFKPIETFARRVACFSYSFHPQKIAKGITRKMILPFFELLDKASHIRQKLKEVGPKFPLSIFPKTYKPGFIDCLVTNLGELLKYDLEVIAPVKHHIVEIQLHLKSFSSSLEKALDLDSDEHPELKDLGNQVISIAHKVEFVVDSIQTNAQWQHLFWLHYLSGELSIADKQAVLANKVIADDKVQNVSQLVPGEKMSRATAPVIDEKVVELSDEEEVIIRRLTRGSSKQGIVSIVGMPGIGKTTLARKVYNNQRVVYHFHCRAWCTVSQVYDKRQMLLEILSDILGLNNEIRQMSKEDLESRLRQCLLRNRYLIVMDDMWDVGAWDDLKNSFPDNINGSRILITSRHLNVAKEIEPNGDHHSLRPFSDGESWKLLEEKIFQGKGCPEELLLVGQEIARQCKGLPLAVVAIAGLLQKTQKKKEWWQKIGESLTSEVIKDPEARCMEILELSYKHLPRYLQACFLYYGVFVEDRDISVSKLIRFWLAEGFILTTEGKSLEDVAEDNLMDLINRNLVMISKRSSSGKVKACRLHDLLRDFCQSKAKHENFLQLVTRRDEPYASFPHSDYGFDIDFGDELDSITYDAYRLCVYLKRVHFVESRPSGLGTRTLIFSALTDSEPRCPYDISFISHNFSLLRVLDFECINMGVSFPDEIGLLVQLRYLAVSGYLHSVPQSIANLQKLETFIVKGLRGKVVLPDTIWRMTRLRHLHVNIHVAFNLDNKDLGGSFHLENLVSFSCPSLSCSEDNAEKIMKRLPSLRKLRCIFFQSRKSSNDSRHFPRLDFLTQLESLNILYYGRALSTCEFILPLNIKKLTLSSFHLPWSHISAIGRLPNLQVLKLVSGAFEGQIWDVQDKEFQALVFLKLDDLNISEWNASPDHLPKLQHLVICNCKDLQKIPYELADIASLEIIEVLRCGQPAEECAKEIGEENNEIKVLISR